jgi:phosphatidylglycerophosphate synthase
MKLVELIYIPNLIDYARIALLWLAMQYTDWRFCVYYLTSYLLDCFDGIAARALGQVRP